jgi:hypothetical protein
MELKELSAMVGRFHRLSECHKVRRDSVTGLHARVIITDLHTVSGRGCGWEPVIVRANMVLLDATAGASDELPPLVKQSFKEGCYSPLTGMEDKE